MSKNNIYTLKKSDRSDKKFMVITPEGKKVHFGGKGYSDFTRHKDSKRKEAYISRHRSRENWSKSGIDTAGFWSRYLLWEKPSLKDSISFIEKKFKIKIVRK